MDKRNESMVFITEEIIDIIKYNMEVKDLIVTYIENEDNTFTLKAMGVHNDIATICSFDFEEPPACKDNSEIRELTEILATVIMMKFEGVNFDV